VVGWQGHARPRILDPIRHAGICRSGRRRPRLQQAAVVPLFTEFERWLPRGWIVLARRRAMVFGGTSPAVRRLLVTELVLPISREQVLAVVESLIPGVPARLVRSALKPRAPELVGSRPASLFGARIPELVGSRPASLFGARIPELVGARIPELVGARIPELVGAWPAGLFGARIPQLIAAGTTESIRTRGGDLIRARTRVLIATPVRVRPRVVALRTAVMIQANFRARVRRHIPVAVGTPSAVPIRGRTTAPVRRRTAVPIRGRTTVPARRRTTVPARRRAAAPLQGRTAVPALGRTAAPLHGRTAILFGGAAAVLVGGRMPKLIEPVIGAVSAVRPGHP
jgi:hypothetical protein